MKRLMLIRTRRFLSSTRRPERFSSLATALRVFHEQNDHFLVPYLFQVPQNGSLNSTNNPWPEETHGANLGRDIRKFVKMLSTENSHKLQNVRRQLDALGFPKIHDWKRFQWEKVELAALKTFQEIEGHLVVPRKFIVPEGNTQWSKPTWGLKLGSQTNALRVAREKLTHYQIQDLEDIGFVWAVSDYTWDELVMPALRCFRELYGHCSVPQVFVVGQGDDKKNETKWPKKLRGYRLGRTVNKIRGRVIFTEFAERDRKELDKLGFYFSSNDQKWQETVLPAFETYHLVNGNCNISKFFIVPEEEPWPELSWGLRLGFVARNIRNRGDFLVQVARDYEKLEKIGFVWNVTAAKWEHAVIPALETYVREHNSINIPANFVVPFEDPWPEVSYGLRLGELATKPARRNCFANFIEIDREQLEALGFFWSAVTDDDVSDSDAASDEF